MVGEPRIIKKYPNRRLYDPTVSRYVCLQDIHDMVTKGVDLVVVEKRTGEDITRAVLLQVIAFLEQPGGKGLLSREFLVQMIRCQERGPRTLTASYLEQSLNLIERQEADGDTNNEPAAKLARRLAQQHYQRWSTVQEEICRKLAN